MFNPQPKKKKVTNKKGLTESKKRDGKCIYCLNKYSLQTHHIITKARGGGNEPENLITLCHSCHRCYHDGSISDYALVRRINYWFKKKHIPVRYEVFEKASGRTKIKKAE